MPIEKKTGFFDVFEHFPLIITETVKTKVKGEHAETSFSDLSRLDDLDRPWDEFSSFTQPLFKHVTPRSTKCSLKSVRAYNIDN